MTVFDRDKSPSVARVAPVRASETVQALGVSLGSMWMCKHLWEPPLRAVSKTPTLIAERRPVRLMAELPEDWNGRDGVEASTASYWTEGLPCGNVVEEVKDSQKLGPPLPFTVWSEAREGRSRLAPS